MKKELIITALVFLGVGFLGGYIFESHQHETSQASAVVTPGAPSSGAVQDTSAQTGAGTSGSTMPGLPPGHPPLNIAETVKTLQDQEAKNPADPQPKLALANLFYDNKRFQEAAEWYEKALKLDPKNVNARTDLGTVYFNLGRPTEALAEYKKTLEIEPLHQPTIYNSIIVNLEGTHDLAAARAAWKKLHSLNPDYKGLDALKERLDSAGGGTANP
ncbi:MAG TPA: tetratricopeptide repeat protein [Terriglobia bacterium]|nr:tetratricopeptide repeat protein [Terriglobia bacterium]